MEQKLDQLAVVADTLPAAVKSHAKALVQKMGQKIEGISDTALEWKPETARVVQPTSDRSKLPRGTGIGDIVLGETVVKQPLRVIPIRMWDSRQMWSPDKDDNRLLCWSPDGVMGYTYGLCKNCEYAKFDEEAKRSACNKAKTAMVITEDLSTVFTVNFAKTNYKNGLDWASLMRKAQVVPFKRIYEMKTKTHEKFKNVESLSVETKNENTPDAYIPFLETLFLKFGEDREIFRKKFYEIVETKQQGKVLLTDNSAQADNVTVVEAPVTAEQTSTAKKYSF